MSDTRPRPTYDPLGGIDVEAVRARRDFRSTWVRGYVTPGGTYMLDSRGAHNDDGHDHDLIAVLADDTVVPVRINTNPDTVLALAAALDGRASGPYSPFTSERG